MASKEGAISKESAGMRPDNLVWLSESTMTKGFTLPLAARPGIAEKASLASPSMEAPSERTNTVTRSLPAVLSAMASP